MHRRATIDPASAEKNDRVPAWRLGLFASLCIPLAGAGLPLAVYLPPYYAQNLGLGLGTVGLIFLVIRLLDIIIDPLVGVWSDRTRSRFGRRKPWIAGGAPFFAFATVTLFLPHVLGVTPDAVWLAVSLFFFYIGWTSIIIPYMAWIGELSSQYHQRTRVQTFFQVVTALGFLLVLILPVAADWLAVQQGKAVDQELRVTLMGVFILVTLAPTLVATLWTVGEPPIPPKPEKRASFAATLRIIFGDTLLLRVLASDLVVMLGGSIRNTLFVFYVSFYMGRPDLAAGLFLLQFVFGVFAGPIWLAIGYRLGKHRTVIAAEIAQVLINLSLLLVMPGDLPLLLVLTIAQGLSQGSGALMLRAMVADVADKQRLETGEDRTGLLYSIFALASKAGVAIAVGVALPLVAALGFNPSVENSPEALLGLKLVFALGPALAHGISAIFVIGFALDATRHAAIRQALVDREKLLTT